MQTTEIVLISGVQAVKLPEEFHFDSEKVSIRREGNAVILEPVPPTTWPENFFESIRIDDPAFTRPEQGQTPPIPSLD